MLGNDSARTLAKSFCWRFESLSELRLAISQEKRLFGNWNYFGRMSPDGQAAALCAVTCLLDAGITAIPDLRIGTLSSDTFEHEEEQRRYFADYVGGGRLLGRSSLFVHTLPTSAAADASIVLGLRGPLLYLNEPGAPWQSLAEAAESFVEDGQADAILLLKHRLNSWLGLLVSPSSAGRDDLALLKDSENAPEPAEMFSRISLAQEQRQ